MRKQSKYRILLEFSFSTLSYETSLGNVVKRISVKLYNNSGTSFIKVMTTSVRFLSSLDFSVHTDPTLYTISMGFPHVPT